MNLDYTIYCDMDGVLVDFDKGYEELTGRNIRGKFVSDANFWDPINRAGKNFWINLEWMPDGKKLWNYIKKYNPQILSAPSRENSSRVGKYEWVDRELGAHLILRSHSNKKEFASPTSILIDDRQDNVISWRNAGGIGIHHTSANETIKELKKLGL